MHEEIKPKSPGMSGLVIGHKNLNLTAFACRAALRQVQRVGREHLLRSDRARQDLLLVREPDDGLQRLAIACQTVGERIVTHDAPTPGQNLSIGRKLGA